MTDQDSFGPAASCRNFEEVLQLRRIVVGEGAHAAVPAFGMLVAARSAPPGKAYADALEVLNRLGRAKAALDEAASHAVATVRTTATILAEAQDYVDKVTIPCTEWPTSEEVVAVVADAAKRFGFAGPWRKHRYDSHGSVAGVDELRSSL